MLVLLIDNDAEDIELFQEALLAMNPFIKIVSAEDGKDAFAILQTLPQLPDFIFSDLNMPKMDGKEFLTVIKKEISLQNIPVIIYSTTRNPRERDECLQSGAQHFLIKPTNYSQLMHDLHSVIYPKQIAI
jgi:CheY-like chemotaxis protein